MGNKLKVLRKGERLDFKQILIVTKEKAIENTTWEIQKAKNN